MLNVAVAIAIIAMYFGVMRTPVTPDMPLLAECGKRYGNKYLLCPEQIEAFKEDGLAIADNVLSDEELAFIDAVLS